MALRDLLEGECGASNSLVRLTNHFVQDRGLKDENYRHPFQANEPILSSQDPDQLVQQFLEETVGSTPQSFRMDSLLAEMRDMEVRSAQAPPVQSAPVSQLAIEGDSSCWADADANEENVRSWAEQYIESGRHFMMPEEKGDQYAIWKTDDEDESAPPNLEKYELGFGPNWAQEYLETSEQVDVNKVFMKFMRQIGEGEITIESGEVVDKSSDNSKLGEWSSEFVAAQKPEDWVSEFRESETGAQALSDNPEELDDFTSKLWSKLSHQWEEISNTNETENLWSSEFEDYASNYVDYKFAEDNPMKDAENALEEGLKKRALGDLPSAVLCFEAAVQHDDQNSKAWELLGVTQAEIEQDCQAIIALKKSLSLDPKNLTALMTLAASYTNENFQNQACHALKEWLHANPKYTDLVPESPETISQFRLQNVSSKMLSSFHDEVQAKYLAAARRNPSQGIDADVQCGLGILFNLSSELGKAADCFRAALQARPDDCKLWNRLGATLANDQKSEEAVDAYHHALQLSPGFIRARYNLGITCVHLRAYREAAEHLLTALNQQVAGRGIHGEKSVSMSDSIWSTLRLTVSLLQRSDLIPAVNQRDLKKLNDEFEITDNEG
ncbi:peroxisomal targeting signal 1 receptor [Nilaparvata lugens]|uniref:peroxisomal targeting signal 1 receptor n=1 Tax=Nilaparvata lugens TaxID=108931 RepID=UPI00193C9943|nr:peroxisomal targeting signal 1 receptor [Nilaparvata lugens]